MDFRKTLLCIALFSLVFCMACGSKDQPRTTATTTTSLSAEDEALKALLPGNNEVAGWTQSEEVRFFDPDGLSDFINGAAENFLIYGFEKVVTADYNNAEQPSQIVIDIYQMQDPRNTFGVYASERNPASTFKAIGAEGYIGGTALNFWTGKYYIKMAVFQESESLQQEMEKMAEAISKKIGDAGGVSLPETELFPKADQIPYSTRYLARDVLGQVSFREGFESKYRTGDKESRLVLVLPGDEAAATAALDKYREFTAANGGKVGREVTSPGNGDRKSVV